MSNKLAQNRIHDLAKLLQTPIEKGGIKPSEIEDKETRDMIMWYLKVDKGNSMTDIAILLECDRRTVSECIKKITKQRAVQLEKEGVNLYTEFIRFR